MKARCLTLCLFTTTLGVASAQAQTEAAKPDPSGQMAKRRQEMLKRFDLNEDGKLDEAEKAAMKEARKKQPAAPRGTAEIGSMGTGGEPGMGNRAGEPRGDRFLKEMMKRFDKDGDGKLDEAELAEAMKARAEFGQNRGAGAGGPGAQGRGQMMKMFDKNGDGQLDDEERAAAAKFRDEQIKRFDRNGDGQLDQEERAAAMQAYLADHPEMAPRGR